MAKAGTVAVLLPGAFYFLRETKQPPLDLLRKHRVPIAIATDSNPGTSPLTSLLLTMNMAATCFRMTVEECIAARDARSRARAGAFESNLERSKPENIAILQSGTSRTLPNLFTAWAIIRCMRACGADNE